MRRTAVLKSVQRTNELKSLLMGGVDHGAFSVSWNVNADIFHPVFLHRHPERIATQCCSVASRRSCKEACAAEGLPHVKTPLAISKVTQEYIAKVVQDPSAYGAHSVDACVDQGRVVTTGLQDPNTSDAHGVDTCMGRGRGVAKIAARGGGEKVASASKGVGIEVVVEKGSR